MAFLLQAESAVVEPKAEPKLDTRSTFQLARFWLNADAKLNACGPSHTLAKSPRRMSPEPRRSDQCMVHAAPSGPEACGAMLLALDHRDAAQLRRFGRAQTRRETLCRH
jgi:hypothetical protein